MPEGPSIVLLIEQVSQFAGKTVLAAEGNTKIDKDILLRKKVIAFKSWGKHFLICFKGFTLRVHFLMFGTYRINERKEQAIRLSLRFTNGEINLYSCSLKILEGDVNAHYDWAADVMNDEWDPAKARKKLKAEKETLICDTLLDQSIFAGVGNIIKNEVLYRVRVHPESETGKLSPAKTAQLIKQARVYSFEFLEWKRAYVLKKHWLAHTKKTCLRCKLPIIKKYTGVKNRRSFFCSNCQRLYG